MSTSVQGNIIKNTITQNTIPQNTIPQNTIPQNTIPQNTIPQNTIPQNTIPQNTIAEKLAGFISQNKIPHILFHGPSGCGKRTLVYKFVEDIYNNDKELIKNYTMFADCAHGKGIKFIREELKFFAKTNVNIQGPGHFKTIVLTNADKLTTDAQSALRRCIELFSHNTRFFIIVENKYSLLKPILSRLCDVFIGKSVYQQQSHKSLMKNSTVLASGQTHTTIRNKQINQSRGTCAPNYYKQNIAKLLDTSVIDKQRRKYLETEFNNLQERDKTHHIDNATIVKLVCKLYEKGYSGLDLMNYIDTTTSTEDVATESIFLLKKYELLVHYHKVKAEFRNEKIFMTFILSFFFIRSNAALENISFM
jgi:GTPase SAR1 family protein